MKLISKFCAALVAMLLTATASAGTLYWQVTPDTGVEFSSVKIVVTQGDTRVDELGQTFAVDMGESGLVRTCHCKVRILVVIQKISIPSLSRW